MSESEAAVRSPIVVIDAIDVDVELSTSPISGNLNHDIAIDISVSYLVILLGIVFAILPTFVGQVSIEPAAAAGTALEAPAAPAAPVEPETPNTEIPEALTVTPGTSEAPKPPATSAPKAPEASVGGASSRTASTMDVVVTGAWKGCVLPASQFKTYLVTA